MSLQGVDIWNYDFPARGDRGRLCWEVIAARDEGLLAQSRRGCPIVLSSNEGIVQVVAGLDISLQSRGSRGLCRGSTGCIVADN